MSQGKELTITRIINAPRELVFKVWTDATHLAQWWGPFGLTCPVCETDPRPGGEILIHMKAPDGTVYPMDGTYKEVRAPEKLVFTARALDDNNEPLFEVLNTISFEDESGKTKLTMHASVVAEITPEIKPYIDGMDEGWSESLDKLESYVAMAKL